MNKEADIHFELYRHLKNAIEKCPRYHGISFGSVIPEKSVGLRRADIVVEDEMGRCLLVIEAKRESKHGVDRDLDPYSPRVIQQASEYAFALGADFFATYNGQVLVLFRTFEKGVPLLHRKSRAYEVKSPRIFASELLEQVAALSAGKIGWEPDPRAFVNRLRLFHQRLAKEMLKYVKSPTKHFEEVFQKWAAKQGWSPEKGETQNRFAKQSAYLLMNKLLFYKVLQDTGHDVPNLGLQNLREPNKRRESFKTFTKEADFEAIYEHDPIFDEVHLSDRAAKETGEFLEELEKYDLNRFQYDTIGHIYEDIIPASERHDLGQYYTPPEIVDLIVKATVTSPQDVVLDPACGSGSFLIVAYNQLKKLREEYNLQADHETILSRLIGIDINRFPAHLSAINLAIQDLQEETRRITLLVEDFFNVDPSQGRLFAEKVSLRKPISSKLYETSRGHTDGISAIVANPPYIRQEMIRNKKKCREHLSSIGYSELSERSDIYVYFFTHSSEFLQDGGRMGFITSDKWLTAGYGEGLQRFLLENFRIRAIVSFARRVFTDPLVPTCVTLLEKCSDDGERDGNITKFVRVKEAMEVDDILAMLNKQMEAGILVDSPDYRTITFTQSELRGAEKWNRFVHAPTFYWDLLGHEVLCQLKDIAKVSRGKTTGANDFFYLDRELVKSYNIDRRFLKPLMKSIKQARRLEFNADDTEYQVLDLHEYVNEILRALNSEGLEGCTLDPNTLPSDAKEMELTQEEIHVLNSLLNDGHEGLYEYIIHSMWEKDWSPHEPPQRRPTCTSNRSQNGCWFDLGPLPLPDLLLSREYWEYRRPVCLLNAGTTPDCQMYMIEMEEDTSPIVICGFMNSSLGLVFRELHGRTTGGGMNRLQVYEAENMPVLDPRKVSKEEMSRIEAVIREIVDKGETGTLELDRAILSLFELEDSAEETASIAESMFLARKGATEAGVMVSGIDEKRTRVKKLKGAKIISERQARLTDFSE